MLLEFFKLLFVVEGNLVLYGGLFVIFGAFLAIDLEPEYLGDVALLEGSGLDVLVGLSVNKGRYCEEHVREGTPEVRAVHVLTLLLRDVHVFATGAVDLNSGGAQFFAHAHRQHGLFLAQHSGTDSEGSAFEFLLHDGQSPGGEDVSGVH